MADIFFLFFLSIVLIFTNTYTNPLEEGNRIYWMHQDSEEKIMMLFLIISSLSFLWMLLKIKYILIKKVVEIGLFTFLYIDLCYFLITGGSYGYYEAINTINNYHFAGPATKAFTSEFVVAFILTGLYFFIAYKFIQGIEREYTFRKWPYLILSSVVPVFLIRQDENRTDLLPSPFRIPAAISFSLHNNTATAGHENVTLVPHTKAAPHLTFIVDESINSKALGINNSSVNTTPFLNSVSYRFINNGNCYSFFNYSAGANYSLYKGANLDSLPDRSRRLIAKPGLFEYARKAGYKTIFIDNQIKSGSMQNYFSTEDLKHVDHYIQTSGYVKDFYLRDIRSIDTMMHFLSSSTPCFIWMNKVGAHWPYKASFPKDSSFGLEERKSCDPEVEDYLKSVRWSVDYFFKCLLQNKNFSSDNILVYTSDHGENYRNCESKLKHGSLTNVAKEEGEVPYLLFNFPTKNFFRDSSLFIRSGHHQQIFPALLILMGYDEQEVLKMYPCGQRHHAELHTGDIFGRGRTDQYNY